MNRKNSIMTTAYATTLDRPIFSAPAADLATLASRAQAAWTRYRTYRRTLSELRALSQRSLEDLDLNRADLVQSARRSVYGA